MNKLMLGVLFATAFVNAAHANPLTTDELVLLSKSGIGDDAIIAKVKSSETHINLSVDQMLALKTQGVSGPVMAALMTEARPTAPAFSMDSPDPSVNHPAGVYLLDEPGAKMVRIDAVVTNQAKTGGIIGYALTGGIASMSVKASIQNPSAKTHSSMRHPAFYFFFDESNVANGAVQATWAAGTAATVTSPGEFTLVRLVQKSGRREARVGSVNLAGAKTGVMDSDRLAFDYTLVRPGVFRVVPTTELTPGEYGFIYSVAGGGASGAVTARIFDFSV